MAYGISDIDLVYFDTLDISSKAENEVAGLIKSTMPSCKFQLDITNQAGVHLWYKKYFGYDILPYHFVEHAICSWPTTAMSIGVRLEEGKLKVFAPFGLNDTDSD